MPARTLILLMLTLLRLSGEPAYVLRGRQTEIRQRAYGQRIQAFHDALASALEHDAPDLLPSLEPPPPINYGYQILPRLLPDKPLPETPSKPQVVRYSWAWSDTLYARETEALAKLEAQLERISTSGGGKDAYRALVDDYRKAVDRRRPIDADVGYNWLWQAAIAADRPRFERDNKKIESALAGEIHDEVWRGIDAPSFVRIEHAAEHEWLLGVRIYTDVADAAFLSAFKNAVEKNWQVRRGPDQFRVRLELVNVTPEELRYSQAPGKGERIDTKVHIARFPRDGAVLTTGAASLHVTGGRAILLGPHDVRPRTLAHEFGHLLGFDDAYLRGYKDLGPDGFQVLELVPDATDIMSDPGSGSVLARHFDAIISGRQIQEVMTAGVDALYQRGDAAEAAARFREVLRENPAHYGATLQLAKALDRMGRPEEAVSWWKKILEMSLAIGDSTTIQTARQRLQN